PSLPPAARSDQTPPTAIHTLSLHDALPISEITDKSFAFFYQFYSSLIHLVKIIRSKIKPVFPVSSQPFHICFDGIHKLCLLFGGDRKSTRLNSSHVSISYAVFCLRLNERTA